MNILKGWKINAKGSEQNKMCSWAGMGADRLALKTIFYTD